MALPYEPRASGSTRTSAKAIARVADAAGGTADAPGSRHLLQRPQDEVTPLHLAMRDVQRSPPPAAPAPARPKQYVQVEHPAAPSTAAAAAEAGFQIFQEIKKGGRVERRAHDNGGIGEASCGRPQRRSGQNCRAGFDRQSRGRQCLDRAAKDSRWRPEASMPPVRSQSDRIEMRGHGLSYRPVPETIPSAQQDSPRDCHARNQPPPIVAETLQKQHQPQHLVYR